MKFNENLLAKDLRKFQKESGYTLDEIEAKTGVKKSTLSRIRHGKNNAKFLEVVEVAFLMGFPLNRYVIKSDEVKK